MKELEVQRLYVQLQKAATELADALVAITANSKIDDQDAIKLVNDILQPCTKFHFRLTC